ncbi:MAG: hypothetical protein COA70_07740 [Planctomycetota bacterium]|nr:MAG: hypothetical protein COA70_07740 [Planctomycetota bacterium]
MLPFLLLPLFIFSPQEPSGLREELNQARTYVNAGDGAAAYVSVVKLVEDHEGDALLLKHLPAIQDVLIDSLYLKMKAEASKGTADAEVPDLPFLAEIRSYKEKTGLFKLRWEGENQLGDFSISGGVLRFPISMKGKFRLALELTPYPAKGQIRFLMDNQAGQQFEIDCGLNASGLNRQVAKAYRVKDGGFELMDREDKKLPAPGKKILIQVKGTGSSLSIYAGNKKYLSFKSGKAPIGFITVEGLEDGALTAVEYDGVLDLEGMADLVQRIREQSRERFRSQVDPKEHFPEWVHSHLSVSGFNLNQLERPGGDLSPEEEDAWKAALDSVHSSRSRGLPVYTLTWFQDTPPDGLPEVLRQYGSLLTAFEGGYWSYARGHANNVLQSELNHAPTQHLLIESLAMEGNGDQCWDTAKKFYLKNPDDPSFVIQAALLLMRINMADDLKFFLEREEDLPDELKERCFDLLAHREKPLGKGMRTETGAHLEVTSDLPRDALEALTNWLAREIVRSKGFLPEDTLQKEEKLRVFLFADRWDYEEFTTEIIAMAHPSAAGFYSQEYGAVIAWANPNEEDLKSSLRRELMIQIGKRIHPEYPVWASIGLAEIVGDAGVIPGRKMKTLSKRGAHLMRTGKEDELIPFAVMLHMSDPMYYALEAERNMEVQAWLMMLALTLGGQESDLDVIDQLIEGPRSGKTWAETVDDVFERWGGPNVGQRAYSQFVKLLGTLEFK